MAWVFHLRKLRKFLTELYLLPFYLITNSIQFKIEFSGIDIVDGTPVIDIKPYHAAADIVPPEQVFSF